jgi:hypothetical protein
VLAGELPEPAALAEVVGVPLLLPLLLQAAMPTAQATANAPMPIRRESLDLVMCFAVLRWCHPANRVAAMLNDVNFVLIA